MISYLSNPPPDRPAVIVDGGGLVNQYLQQTEYYRRTGQELRLLNCRSACTMALNLPNACVYPHSVLKFHAAYNANTKQIDEKWTQRLMEMYPIKVQQRLGVLERPYKTLRGSELIKLGVRRCR
jgi:hypothetical protein